MGQQQCGMMSCTTADLMPKGRIIAMELDRCRSPPLLRPPSCFPSTGMQVYCYVSTKWMIDSPILMAMHGHRRDGVQAAKELHGAAEEAGLLLVCPVFSGTEFPGRNSYNCGNIFPHEDATKTPNSVSEWSFSCLETLFVAVKMASGATRDKYWLFGCVVRTAASRLQHILQQLRSILRMKAFGRLSVRPQILDIF
eukprot:SAG31_NODE_1807_length_7230_cov_4.804885_2_plen_196_part_00